MICLRKVLGRFQHRMGRLESVLKKGEASTGKERDFHLAAFLIELPTAFALVARSAYLAGAMSGRTAAGLCMKPRLFSSRHDALLQAASVVKKKPTQVPGRDEPSWQSFDHLARIAAHISIANVADFNTATSMFPATGTVVTSVRNFYAHRTKHTLERVRDEFRRVYGIALTGHPSDSLTISLGSRTAPLAWEWAGHYRDIAEAICGR